MVRAIHGSPATRIRLRRNANKHTTAVRSDQLASLAIPSTATAGQPQAAAGAVGGSQGGGGLLLAPGTTPREAWVAWLSPRFPTGSAYFTGTYSDEYGYPNGLTLARNVHKDFRRYLDSFGFEGDFICGVEPHRYRDVLHLHGILQGDFTPKQLQFLKAWWSLDRGHARVLPVLDGCASYVTKYALKGDTESFDWNLS